MNDKKSNNPLLEPKVDKPKRRYVKPRFATKPGESQRTEITTVVPNIDTLMNDALSIISSELYKYRLKTSKDIPLDLKEARAIQGYMETLVKLSKENREQARADDLANLSDEELAQLAAQVLKLPKPESSNE